MRAASVVFLVACASLAHGCGAPDRHLRRKVAATEIVGTWKMTEASLKLLQRDGYTPSADQPLTITFAADGSLAFASVLEHAKGDAYAQHGGKWHLRYDTEAKNVLPKANTIELEMMRPDDTFFSELSLTEHAGKLRLWDYYGDPDAWEFIEYERL